MGAENISVIKMGDTLMVMVPADPDDETVFALQERILAAMEKQEVKELEDCIVEDLH